MKNIQSRHQCTKVTHKVAWKAEQVTYTKHQLTLSRCQVMRQRMSTCAVNIYILTQDYNGDYLLYQLDYIQDH
jgi:hypothetical protein